MDLPKGVVQMIQTNNQPAHEFNFSQGAILDHTINSEENSSKISLS